MANELVYEVSEYTLGLPVGVAEVDALLSLRGRPIAKDLDKLTHFLRRVRHTIDTSAMDLAAMRRRVDELLVASNQPRGVGPANPAQALKFASPEEIEEVVDRLSKDRLVSLRRMIDTAANQYEELTKVHDLVKDIVDKAEADADISPEVAAAIRASFETHVSVPAGLEQDPDGSDSGWRPPTVLSTDKKAKEDDKKNTGRNQATNKASATATSDAVSREEENVHTDPADTASSTSSLGTSSLGTIPFDTTAFDTAGNPFGTASAHHPGADEASVVDEDGEYTPTSPSPTAASPTTVEEISIEELNAPAPLFDIAEAPQFPVTSPFTEPLTGWASTSPNPDVPRKQDTPGNQAGNRGEQDAAVAATVSGMHDAEVDLANLFDDDDEVDFEAIFKDES